MVSVEAMASAVSRGKTLSPTDAMVLARGFLALVTELRSPLQSYLAWGEALFLDDGSIRYLLEDDVSISGCLSAFLTTDDAGWSIGFTREGEGDGELVCHAAGLIACETHFLSYLGLVAGLPPRPFLNHLMHRGLIEPDEEMRDTEIPDTGDDREARASALEINDGADRSDTLENLLLADMGNDDRPAVEGGVTRLWYMDAPAYREEGGAYEGERAYHGMYMSKRHMATRADILETDYGAGMDDIHIMHVDLDFVAREGEDVLVMVDFDAPAASGVGNALMVLRDLDDVQCLLGGYLDDLDGIRVFRASTIRGAFACARASISGVGGAPEFLDI